MVRSQVGVIWFRLKVRGIPVHVAHAGSGANAIMAAYHLIHSLQKLEAAWNERAKTDPHFKTLNHRSTSTPALSRAATGLQRAGLVRCRLPHCRAAGLVDRRVPEGDSGLRVGGLARPSLLSNILPTSNGRFSVGRL